MNLDDWSNQPEKAWDRFVPSGDQPWNTQRIAHLFRRTGFGGTIEQINAAKSDGFENTIDQLFARIEDESIEEQMATAGRLASGGADSKSLAAWWLLRMIKTETPFLEKMTFFWHGHFATGADKVLESRAMLHQNELLRKYAFGKFRPLVEAISRDVAMLIYLDSEENRKTRPNENYARELMELFCLGPGNYTESDIKEIARCFTGWEIKKHKFRFNKYQHDKNEKTFLHTRGFFTGDDAIRIVLEQPAAARFIARKLVRHFIFDDAPITDSLIEPVAAQLRETEFDFHASMKSIVSSNLFFSQAAMGNKIKSPVGLAVGFLRFFEASTGINQLVDQLDTLGQIPFHPPNVKGWPGGRTWINASSILARANLIGFILNSDKTKFKSGSLDAWFAKHSNWATPNRLDWAEEYLMTGPLSHEVRTAFSSLVKKNSKFGPKQQISWLAALPEFQLG